MTNKNLPTRTWVNPRPVATPEWMRPIVASLEQFLARPYFLNGVDLGDGTGITKDQDGVKVKPELRDWSKDAIATMEAALGDLGTDLSTVYATLATMQADLTALETDPIDGTRITSNSIDTPQLKANSVTATQLAAMSIGVGKWIASTSYSAGVSGWIIAADGTAEFNTVTVRGAVVSNSFQTVGSGARVRMGTTAGATGTDEIQFLGSSGGVGSIRHAQATLGYTTSLRVSAGGIIDVYNNGSSNRIVLTANGGVDVNGDLAVGAINGTAGWFTTGHITNSGNTYTGLVSATDGAFSSSLAVGGANVLTTANYAFYAAAASHTHTSFSNHVNMSGYTLTASGLTLDIFGSLLSVSIGAANSGGSGFRVLRVPN